MILRGSDKTATSRCIYCGKEFTWKTGNEPRFYDIVKKAWRYPTEPAHCGCSLCSDFHQYRLEHEILKNTDIEYAQEAYINMLVNKGVMHNGECIHDKARAHKRIFGNKKVII